MITWSIFTVLLTALAFLQRPDEVPRQFMSRTAAQQAGCHMVRVKGRARESCVLARTQADPTRVVVYDRATDGSYTASDDIAVPSQYWEAKLSFKDVLGAGTDWLFIETTGMHGTAIHQTVLLLLAWDGAHFKVVAAESLGYECYRPSSTSEYKLRVSHSITRTGDVRTLLLQYELTRDGREIGRWTDGLRWNAVKFAFEPSPPVVDSPNRVVAGIRDEMRKVRDYLRMRPPDPRNNLDRWFGDSGLLDVLGQPCSQ